MTSNPLARPVPFGGLLKVSATIVFGGYFVTALVSAFVAIKGGDVIQHRRWMIRAFAIGLALGTIRIGPVCSRIRAYVIRERLRRGVLAVVLAARAGG